VIKKQQSEYQTRNNDEDKDKNKNNELDTQASSTSSELTQIEEVLKLMMKNKQNLNKKLVLK
jgi:hypothetical protein